MVKFESTVADLELDGIGESLDLRAHDEPVDMVNVVAALNGHVRVKAGVGAARERVSPFGHFIWWRHWRVDCH